MFAGETVRCSGTVTAVDGGLITVDQRVEVVEDGRVAVAPATTEVELGTVASGTVASGEAAP